MKKELIKIITMPITIIILGGTLIGTYINSRNPDAEVVHKDEIVASSICGLMYTVDDKTTRADFQLLLQRTREACKDEPEGTETSYTNPDGSLKHVVIIGDEDTVRTKGSEYDTCVINWELDQITAFKAFENVCLNRQF